MRGNKWSYAKRQLLTLFFITTDIWLPFKVSESVSIQCSNTKWIELNTVGTVHFYSARIYILKVTANIFIMLKILFFLNNCYPFELFVRQTITLCKYIKQHNNNNYSVHLYSAFLGTQSTLHRMGGISSTTTNVQYPPGWCDGSHIAPERPPHTILLVERRQSNEANQCMGMISVWGWLGGHDGQRLMGEFGQDAEVTPLLFYEGHPGIFIDHRESGPRFNVSSERRCFLTE